MYWNGHDMGGWGWFAASLTMLLFLALVVAVAVYAVRLLARDEPSSRIPPASATGARTAAPSAAEALLAERFARGEIDEEEYARRLAVLRAHSAGRAPL